MPKYWTAECREETNVIRDAKGEVIFYSPAEFQTAECVVDALALLQTLELRMRLEREKGNEKYLGAATYPEIVSVLERAGIKAK